MNVESMQNLYVGTSVSGKCISHKERCDNNSEAPSVLSGKWPYLYAMCDSSMVSTTKPTHDYVLIATVESSL